MIGLEVRLTSSGVSLKRFKRETFSISFDRSAFCAYKVRVDPFQSPSVFKERDSKA